MLTFKSADNVREAASALPLASMLLETDAPYLAPAPFRGRPNESSFLPRTAARLAEVKSVPLEEVARVTTENFKRLFRVA
jgi:TatD DNase family protein